LDEGGRKTVLLHEDAHRIVDDLEANSSDFWNDLLGSVRDGMFGPLSDEGLIISGINGQFTPLENLVEAFAVYQQEPEWLEEKYPMAYEYVRSKI
jgi:hypothetical protein